MPYGIYEEVGTHGRLFCMCFFPEKNDVRGVVCSSFFSKPYGGKRHPFFSRMDLFNVQATGNSAQANGPSWSNFLQLAKRSVTREETSLRPPVAKVVVADENKVNTPHAPSLVGSTPVIRHAPLRRYA